MNIFTSAPILAFVLTFAATTRAATPAAFLLPPVNYPNVTEATWGYNPWMSKYITDPTKITIVMMTGGCLSVEEGGSAFYQDAAKGFWQRCAELDINCQCRPIIKPTEWNPPMEDNSIYYDNNITEAAWHIKKLFADHRAGRINVGAISAKAGYETGLPEIYDEARELDIPIFLMGK
jgi:hypothetical protein